MGRVAHQRIGRAGLGWLDRDGYGQGRGGSGDVGRAGQ